MRLAWLISLGVHVLLIGAFVLAPFGGRTTPPHIGAVRIGFVSEESRPIEPRQVVLVTAPPKIAPHLPSSPTIELPLLAPHRPLAPIPPPSTLRVRPPRRRPEVLSSATVESAPATSASEGVFAPPSPLHNPAPRYPSEARRRGWQGSVLLLARVGTDGGCLDARVLSSSGHRCLDEAALDAVRGWTFTPATRSGLPVVAEVEVPIHFVLR